MTRWLSGSISPIVAGYSINAICSENQSLCKAMPFLAGEAPAGRGNFCMNDRKAFRAELIEELSR